jgi:Rad51
MSGNDVQVLRSNIVYITTGSQQLDALLGGKFDFTFFP